MSFIKGRVVGVGRIANMTYSFDFVSGTKSLGSVPLTESIVTALQSSSLQLSFVQTVESQEQVLAQETVQKTSA